MTKQELLNQYHDWVMKMSAYEMALSIIGIDKQTVAPTAGSKYRDERTAYLAGELFSIEVDPKMTEVRNNLLQMDIDEDTREAIVQYNKKVARIVAVPKEEFVAFRNLCDQSFEAWIEAKEKNDYQIFEPYLKQLIEGSKKMYGYRNSDKPIYDQMLEDFEPNMSMEKYDVFFEQLKARIVPLIQKISSAKKIQDDFLYQDFSIEKQKEFMDFLLKYLCFDSSWGYQNESEHPFTAWTCENDCRTTTKYLKDNVVSAIFSTVHEVGHATYEHQISPKYDGMILSNDVSSGMHESQSRFCENYLGRSMAFWKANYPQLQKIFSSELGSVSLEEFVAAVNVVKPSLIRVEADELTYPLHILIRYEIEKGLFNGTISTEGLDQTWNDLYQKYLGVHAENASEGILQDVHWSDASFGYFPTYALGTAYAAQFLDAMKKDIDVDQMLESSRYDVIMDWLKEHIHQYGCRYSPQEIMKKVSGEAFDPNYFIAYLEEKYSKLYQL